MATSRYCPHYNGDGYEYKMIDARLYLCPKCNKRILKQMVKQAELEEKAK